MMAVTKPIVDPADFNGNLALPYDLRITDFSGAMQDVYDFFYDVNKLLVGRGLARFDDMLRPAQMSGLISDMLTESIAKHSRTLTVNKFHNGHPDLIVQGVYPNNAVQSGEKGVEIKSTGNAGGGVDMHGVRAQWLCVFVRQVDRETEPANERRPMIFTEAYLAYCLSKHFRKNDRGERGTRTASLNRAGLMVMRAGWLYKLNK